MLARAMEVEVMSLAMAIVVEAMVARSRAMVTPDSVTCTAVVVEAMAKAMVVEAMVVGSIGRGYPWR
jgi:hypothetical protein